MLIITIAVIIFYNSVARRNYRKMNTSRKECKKVQEASNLLKQQMKIFLLVVVVKVTAHYLYELIIN